MSAPKSILSSWIAVSGEWDSGPLLHEDVARYAAELRSTRHPRESVIVWRVLDGKRIFIARYQRGTMGKPRHHDSRRDSFPKRRDLI